MTAVFRPRIGSRRASVAIVAALVLGACSTTPASVAPASGAPASVAPASVAPASGVSGTVKSFVEKYKGLPTFTPPGPALDVSSLKGKSVFIMNQAPNPFNQSIQVAMSDIAAKVGMKVTLYPNQGVVSQWVQGMDAAVTQHPDIIILNAAPDPRFLQPQLAAAKAAGIPVVVDHFYDDSSPNPPACDGCTGVTATVTAPFNLAGEAATNWIIQDSAGAAHVLIVGSADILPSPPTVAVMKKTFADNCPACKLTEANVPVQDWNTKVQGEVQAALVKDPSINYVYVLYDAMVSGAVPAVQTVGVASKVKVASYNGSPYAMKYIQDHNVVALEIGEDTIGIGYATMDQAFRILLGQPTVPERTPIRIWDATNISESGTPPTIGTGYGNALPQGFLKLWGLQP